MLFSTQHSVQWNAWGSKYYSISKSRFLWKSLHFWFSSHTNQEGRNIEREISRHMSTKMLLCTQKPNFIKIGEFLIYYPYKRGERRCEFYVLPISIEWWSEWSLVWLAKFYTKVQFEMVWDPHYYDHFKKYIQRIVYR